MTSDMKAQSTTISAAGEYYLQNVMETASGFKLNEDSSFQFFFSYGALDRMGEGTWSVQGDSIVLNSRKKPSHDFALLNSRSVSKDSINIWVINSNQMVSRHLYCIIRGGGREQQGHFGNDGMIRFEQQPVESIELHFRFCPEKTSVFTIEAKEHNYFEFRFEPWIMELFFENFRLQTGNDRLSGAHPLLNGGSFVYKRESD
jgi:hypothetical protein